MTPGGVAAHGDFYDMGSFDIRRYGVARLFRTIHLIRTDDCAATIDDDMQQRITIAQVPYLSMGIDSLRYRRMDFYPPPV